jgi:hypothetical protein
MKEMKTSSAALSLMKFSTLVAILSATLTLSGCLDGSATLGEQMQVSESIPMNETIADQVVHQYIHDSFKDPYSVQDLTIGRPYLQKSYKGLVNGGGFNYVWNIPFSCNGKNSYGGYTGIKRSVALYNGSTISGYPLDEPL